MRTPGINPGAGTVSGTFDLSPGSGNERHIDGAWPPAQELREYQKECVDAVRRSYAAGHRAPLLVQPTGGGKTVVFANITARARHKGRRVLVIVHRVELIQQASEKLTLAGVPHRIMAAGLDRDHDAPVIVASVQTLAARLESLPQFDLIVIDEAHHAIASTWRAVLDAQPQAKLLGVTATPLRLDGRGLGVQTGGIFDDLIVGPSIRELVAQGHLAPARAFTSERRLNLAKVRSRAGDYRPEDLEAVVDTPEITGDAVQKYRRLANHQPAIAFCCSVEHAEHVAASFRAAGYRSQCVHGGLNARERKDRVAGLADRRVEVLTTCDLVSEGLDVPAVGAVILLRPTRSLALFMQQVGRGMRPAKGKVHLIVQDHVGNVLIHGLPDTDRAWSLAGARASERTPQESGELACWVCDDCRTANPLASRLCLECGAERAGGVVQVPGTLAEVPADHRRDILTLSWAEFQAGTWTEAQLRRVAEHRAYKEGWIWHVLRAQKARDRRAQRAAA